jgi:ATP-binding protein involved in chromosome partitioning
MSPRQQTPQEQARLETIKRAWQQKKKVSENLDRIKHKIGVYSGKGGVGKTTISVNLAVTLAQQGYKVGIFDVDIDCPNVTKVMNMRDRPQVNEGRLIPPELYGVKVVSMAFFQENEDEAIIWRGPMVHNAINQFLEMTEWGDLDYLIIDLPPGTSDAPLTVMQVITVEGFVAVTTPQYLAVLDAKRSINMIKKMNVNILGVVENFSGEIFGTGAGEILAQDMGVPFLGKVELRSDYRQGSKPTVLVSQEVLNEFENIASNMIPILEGYSNIAQ